MKYLLDYGHGGNDPGAIGIDNLKEKDIVREIGKRVKYHLERVLLLFGPVFLKIVRGE